MARSKKQNNLLLLALAGAGVLLYLYNKKKQSLNQSDESSEAMARTDSGNNMPKGIEAPATIQIIEPASEVMLPRNPIQEETVNYNDFADLSNEMEETTINASLVSM